MRFSSKERQRASSFLKSGTFLIISCQRLEFRSLLGLQRSKFVRPLGEDVRVFLADEAFAKAFAWDSPLFLGWEVVNNITMMEISGE